SAPSSAPSTAAAVPTNVDPLITKGAAIYAAGPCGSCHGNRAEGTSKAPSLIGVGGTYSADRLSFFFHQRAPDMIDGGMPPVNLDKSDTDALVAFLRSLK